MARASFKYSTHRHATTLVSRLAVFQDLSVVGTDGLLMLLLGFDGAMRLVHETDTPTVWHIQEEAPSVERRRERVRHRPQLVARCNAPCVALSPDGSRFASVHPAHETWALRDTAYGTQISKYEHAPATALQTIVFSPCGTMVATTSEADRLDVFRAYGGASFVFKWSFSTKAHLPAARQRESYTKLYSASFSADSKYVAAVCLHGSVHIMWAADGTPFKTIDMRGRGEFSPTECNKFAAISAHSLVMWDVIAETQVWGLGGYGDRKAALASTRNFLRFAPDGKTLAFMQPGEDAGLHGEDSQDDMDDSEAEEEDVDTGAEDVVVVNTLTGSGCCRLRAAQVPDAQGVVGGWRPNDIRDMSWSADGLKLACVGVSHCLTSEAERTPGTPLGLCVVWDIARRAVVCRINSRSVISAVAFARDFQAERRLALAMALHPRVGRQSLLHALGPDALRMLFPDAAPLPPAAGPALFWIQDEPSTPRVI